MWPRAIEYFFMKKFTTLFARKSIVEFISAMLFLSVSAMPAYASLTFTADTITSTDATNGLVITTAGASGATFAGGPVKLGTGVYLDTLAAGALNIGTTTATSIVFGNQNTTTFTYGSASSTNITTTMSGSLAGGQTRTLRVAAPTAGAGD